MRRPGCLQKGSPETASRSQPPWLRAALRGRKENRNGATAKVETAMSIRYGVFVRTAVLTFGFASAPFFRRRTARSVTQEPTVPGRAMGPNHAELVRRKGPK